MRERVEKHARKPWMGGEGGGGGEAGGRGGGQGHGTGTAQFDASRLGGFPAIQAGVNGSFTIKSLHDARHDARHEARKPEPLTCEEQLGVSNTRVLKILRLAKSLDQQVGGGWRGGG